jgi:hypothetical protein
MGAPEEHRKNLRGVVLEEALARSAAAGRMEPPHVLAADLAAEPGAEVGHCGPGEHADLLGAYPAQLQALEMVGARQRSRARGGQHQS